VLLASHAAPLARVVEHHVVVQLDRALAGSACGAEDDVELDVGAAHRLVGPAPCHAAAHRASREGSATDKGRHGVLVNISCPNTFVGHGWPQVAPQAVSRYP